MTTINRTHSSLVARGIRADEHPHWMNAFRDETRMQQLEDDRLAWTAVTGTLLTIVTIGVTLAMISVAICMAN